MVISSCFYATHACLLYMYINVHFVCSYLLLFYMCVSLYMLASVLQLLRVFFAFISVGFCFTCACLMIRRICVCACSL